MPREFESAITTDFKDKLDYAGYLGLEQLLTSQHPLSNPVHHDELLFIIQHQTSELWMKLVIHELQAAIESVQNDTLEPAFKILARVKHVLRMLYEQWSVLETLTPSEYVQFRHVLGNASGFQSFQYRHIEFLLGNKDAASIQVFKHSPKRHQTLLNALQSPSLYDEFLAFLSRQRLPVPQDRLERDFSKPYESSEGVIDVFKIIYDHPHLNWTAYEMAEKLLDLEEQLSLWRYRHMLTVERIIGFKRGTGGSSGVPFLRKAVDIRVFPELWQVRTEIERV